MTERDHASRAKGTARFWVPLPVAFTDTFIAPPNPKRCGLIVSGNGQQIVFDANSQTTADGNTTTGGILIGPSRTALVLGHDMVYGVLNGEIHASGLAANATISVVEIFYLD